MRQKEDAVTYDGDRLQNGALVKCCGTEARRKSPIDFYNKLILISELAAIAGVLKGRRKVRTFQYSLSLFDLGCIDLSCGDSPSSRG